MAWPPLPEALTIEASADAGLPAPGWLRVEHCNEPFVHALNDASETSLQEAAFAYLTAMVKLAPASPAFDVVAGWLGALDPHGAAGEPYFGWLPIDDDGAAAYASFVSDDESSAMLFASERFDATAYMGSGFGLAVPLHLRGDAKTNNLEALCTGFAATLPYGWFWTAALSANKGITLSFTLSSLLARAEAVQAVQAATGFQKVAFDGARVAKPGPQRYEVELFGFAAESQDPSSVPYAVTVQGTIDHGAGTFALTHVSPMVADAAGSGDVFVDDPSSQNPKGQLLRPTRDFSTGRTSTTVGNAANVVLQYPPGARPLVKVMPCPRFVRADRSLNAKNPRPITLGGNAGEPPVRSDDASALQAFVPAIDLVDRLVAYGWKKPEKYFRAMLPDVRILYRSGVVPGPGKDGRTVNACVAPEGWPASAASGPRRAINIHVAAADLRRRARATWTPGGDPSPAVPFGLGADRRWMWHEFGHVLLAARTGELEFRFAHSAGDALAAIVADATSHLQARARTLTFPFAFVPRYHNRCAHAGWSWSGTQHAGLAAVPLARQPRRKGYASEQILSSSLFRLYRCIGGDTATQRQRASHYMVYLIMRAIALMGHARIHPVPTPAEFVDLLIHADRYVGNWSAFQNTFERVGGTAGKVIRWAFEAQGLYGDGDAPGAAPPVDIYIPDHRPEGDAQEWGGTAFGPGTYVPVPLQWQTSPQASQAWQAHPRAGIVTPAPVRGKVDVFVGNRGSVAAQAVRVQLWMTAWPANPASLLWNDPAGTWAPCATSAAQNIAAGAAPVRFSFSYDAPLGPHILVAVAGCAADRANADIATGLPCSTLPTPVIDLVANDNNIALLVVP